MNTTEHLSDCGECQRLIQAKEDCWQKYQHQKFVVNVELFKHIQSTEESDQLLADYGIASARHRHHVATKHPEVRVSVSEKDLKLLADEDGS